MGTKTDLTCHSDQELSLVVFNTEYLYRIRNQSYLFEVLEEAFIFSGAQRDVLLADLEEDRAETYGAGFVTHSTFELYKHLWQTTSFRSSQNCYCPECNQVDWSA